MKLAFLLTQSLDSPSGLGRYAPMAKELARLGHHVQIFALHPDFQSLEQKSFEQDGLHIHYVAPMHIRKQGSRKIYYSPIQTIGVAANATWHLCRAALATDAEILYICKPHPMNSLAGLAGKYLRKKFICLDCDDYETGSGNFRVSWQKKVVAKFEEQVPRHVRLTTTNTHFLHQKLLSWGVSAERIFYLPNGVDRQRFVLPAPAEISTLRHHLDIENKKVVLYIGSMSLANHAVDLLLEAFVEVLAACPEAVLLLVGGGEDYDKLQKRAQALNIEAASRWIGRVSPELAVNYYHLAQVSVDPVYDDNAARGRSPLKLFESWACGVPFVSADVGDRKLLAGSPPAALLTRPGNATALCAGILQVLTDPHLAETLQKRGLERVQTYFWDQLALQAEKILVNIR